MNYQQRISELHVIVSTSGARQHDLITHGSALAVAAEADAEIASLTAELDAALDALDALKEELKSAKCFSDLWYFVMDERPLEFERIVNRCAPENWLEQAQKLMKESK